MSLPSRSDQASIMKRLMRENTFNEGEKAYIVSMSWLNKWKSAVGFDNKPPIGNVTPIDNKSLLQNGVLKKALVESFDYEIFSYAIWNKLQSWYGGGPEIPVQVEYDPVRKQHVPVTRLTTIIILFNHNKKSFQISKYKTIGDLKRMACKNYQISYDAYKLHDIWNGKKDVAFDENKVISQLFLKDGQTLLLDQINDDEEKDFDIYSRRSRSNRSTPIKGNSSPIRGSTQRTNSPTRQIPQQRATGQGQNQGQITHHSSPQKSFQSSTQNSFQNNQNSTYQNSYQSNSSSRNQIQSFTQQNQQSEPSSNIFFNGSPYFSSPSSTPGICGLVNLGNTCFFNSVLQCLLHCPYLVNYIKSGKFKQDLAPNNPLGTKCQLVNAFASLVNEIWTQKTGLTAPKELLFVLSRHAPHFAGFSQQDAHELLIFFLDLLHEDLNRVKTKPELKEIHGDGSNDMETAEMAWEQYKKINDSIIVDLFHGSLRSQLVCPQCHNKSVIFEPFVTLSLPIPGPTCLSPEFIFVPYDPCQPKIKMSLPMSFGLNAVSFKRNLTAELQREFEIAFALRTRSSGTIEWLNSPPSPRSFADFIVFEIPDTEKLYTVASINVKTKGKLTFLYDYSQTIDDLLLVPMPKQYPSQEDIENACIERLKYLWDTTDRNPSQISPEVINFVSSIEQFPFPQKKLMVEVTTTMFDRSSILQKLKTIPFILTKSLKIFLNPDFMNDNCGFNWGHIKRPIKNVTPQNGDVVAPTLDNCLKQFSLGMVLDEKNKWYCPNCKDFVCADKKTTIWSLPKCLIFHFKRFTQYYNTFRKHEGKVDFPNEVDFSSFVHGPCNTEKMKYKLYAVCEHYGTMAGGHYTAHAFVDEKKSWYLFNDSSCKPTNQSAAHNEAAYLLFYERIE